MNGRRVSDQLVETIRDRSDLVSVVSEYLTLKKAGQNFTGLCPFHTEKRPPSASIPRSSSFTVSAAGRGDVFQFVMKVEGCVSRSAPKVGRQGGVALPEAGPDERESPARREAAQIYELNEAAAAYFHRNLIERPEGAFCRDYLKGRGSRPKRSKPSPSDLRCRGGMIFSNSSASSFPVLFWKRPD